MAGLPAFLKPVVEVKERPTDPDSAGYVRSFLIVRLAIGVLGLGLPLFLILWDGVWLDGDPFFRSSVSAYYYSGGRELFVGVLCAIGFFLITYKITQVNLDNTASILAGIAAIVVAFFPTGLPAPDTPLTPLQGKVGVDEVEATHFVAAAVFIGLLALLSYFFGVREGKRRRPGQRLPKEFWRWYHIGLAGVIAVTLAAIGLTELLDWGPDKRLFIGETVAAVAFGLSWLAKGAEFDTLFGRQRAPAASPDHARDAATETPPESPPVLE